MSFYSPIDRLAQTLPRPKGTGSEFMTELSKMPGYKSQEAEDRGLQALVNLPKMERAQFLAKLKAHRGPPVEENTFAKNILRNPGLNVIPNEDPHHEHWTLPGGTNYREILLKHGNPKEDFPGDPAHFGGEPNILASIRAKDRVGPNGEKILHLEEIQSDWHQQGREKGYLNPKEKHTAEEKKYGVPDAPFKKSWHEMALKKMIHHAATSGYDSIAITPGAEQADRYGLARKLRCLEYSKGKDDKYHVIAIPHHGSDLMGGMYDLPELERHIGKDLTKQIAEGQGSSHPSNNAYKVLAGQDFVTGDKGMKGFYDKIVPNFLNQFGKKYGAKVGQIQVPVVHALQGLRRVNNYPDDPPLNLHHFPITPEMREDVTKNGVPLYAKGGSIKPVGYTKERVTVSPNLDAMRYEMESVKHYSKKAK